MSTPEPRRCTVPLPDGSPCLAPYWAKGKCHPHYDAARTERRRKPDARRARDLGSAPVQFSLWVPHDVGQAVKRAVKEARRVDPAQSEARWLEEAIRAHLPPELTPVK